MGNFRTIKALYRAWMLRPILYRTLSKSLTALAAMLCWERFFNNGLLHTYRDVGLIAAIVLLVMAWVNYLRLDGVVVHHMMEERKRKPHRRHRTKDMIDFTEEPVDPEGEMSREENWLCGLLSSLAAGVLFLLLSLVATVL